MPSCRAQEVVPKSTQVTEKWEYEALRLQFVTQIVFKRYIIEKVEKKECALGKSRKRGVSRCPAGTSTLVKQRWGVSVCKSQ